MLLQRVENSVTKHVGTFNASAARQRICVRIELAEAGVAKQLISAKRNSDSEEIEQKLEPKVLLRNFPSVEQIQDNLGSFLCKKRLK